MERNETMSDIEATRRQAQNDHYSNPQTPMANEQSIRNAELRNAYNAELARKREEAERNR